MYKKKVEIDLLIYTYALSHSRTHALVIVRKKNRCEIYDVIKKLNGNNSNSILKKKDDVTEGGKNYSRGEDKGGEGYNYYYCL